MTVLKQQRALPEGRGDWFRTALNLVSSSQKIPTNWATEMPGGRGGEEVLRNSIDKAPLDRRCKMSLEDDGVCGREFPFWDCKALEDCEGDRRMLREELAFLDHCVSSLKDDGEPAADPSRIRPLARRVTSLPNGGASLDQSPGRVC